MSEWYWFFRPPSIIALLLDREFNHSRKCLAVPIHEKLDSQNIWRIQYEYQILMLVFTLLLLIYTKTKKNTLTHLTDNISGLAAISQSYAYQLLLLVFTLLLLIYTKTKHHTLTHLPKPLQTVHVQAASSSWVTPEGSPIGPCPSQRW